MCQGMVKLMLPLLRLIVCRRSQEVPAGGGGRKRAPARPRAFALREEDDGWEAIQDAQNAAATLALHAVRSLILLGFQGGIC